MTFLGKKRWPDGAHPHESPLVMTIPLILLAIGSAIGGLVLNNWIGEWLSPATGGPPPGGTEAPSLLVPNLIGIVTLIVVAAGVVIAVVVFGPRRTIAEEQPASRSPFTLAGRNDLYGDALNETVFMRPGQALTDGLVAFDSGGIDEAVLGTAAGIGQLSSRLRRWQNGFVRSYALTMVVGVAVVGAVLVLGRLG
jgi:NADH-quinone oxidoreductase subunit L